MPINLKALPERLKEAVANGTLVPFIGAGVSRQAMTSDKEAFPSWSELLTRLEKVATEEKVISKGEKKEIDGLIKRGKYLMAAQAIKNELPTDLTLEYLSKWYAPKKAEPSPLHLSLFKLRPPLMITTNYDLLLEDAFAVEFKKAAPAFTYKNAAEVQQFLQSHKPWIDRPVIFKIHGTIASPSETILGELDYRKLIYGEPAYRTVLSAIFVTKVVLMLGFSFSDPELSILFESLRDSMKHRSSPDYLVLSEAEKGSVERKRLREDYGIEVIEYQPTTGHPELKQLVDYLAKSAPKSAMGSTKRATRQRLAADGIARRS